MNEEEIKTTIFGILKNIAPDTEPATLGKDDNIRRHLSIDSFDYLQFIVSLDKTLGITIPEEEYGNIQTLGELIAYISIRLKA